MNLLKYTQNSDLYNLQDLNVKSQKEKKKKRH